MKKKNILVLYYTRGVFPLRNTIETHLYCWKKFSKHRVFYVNVAFGFPWELIRNIPLDAVIFHTIFLSMRWSPSIFKEYTEKCAPLKTLNCTKIAIPQDEFIHTELLNDFINEFGVTHLLTCAYEQDWPYIYNKVDRSRVQFKNVLTGYLDAPTLERIQRLKERALTRDIDISYRAWKAEYWLGEHGMHKVWVAERSEQAAQRLGIGTDISMRDADVLSGDDWFAFLLRSKATVGVEGGASILDRTGEVKARVDAYLAEHPEADFYETRQACFVDADHQLGLACISPRHLEACATETAQILIEGTFNGILEPGKHYVPIKKDYSNLDEALQVVQDPARLKQITDQAYQDVVQSNRWTYQAFVREIEEFALQQTPVTSSFAARWTAPVYAQLLNVRDAVIWQYIRCEILSYAAEITSRQRARFNRFSAFLEKNDWLQIENIHYHSKKPPVQRLKKELRRWLAAKKRNATDG